MDSSSEEKYWRENHDKQPFVKPGHTYADYAPAYKTGYEGAQKHPDKNFEEVEPHLATEFQKHKSMIEWDDARAAARAAWDKVGNVIQPRDVSRGVRFD